MSEQPSAGRSVEARALWAWLWARCRNLYTVGGSATVSEAPIDAPAEAEIREAIAAAEARGRAEVEGLVAEALDIIATAIDILDAQAPCPEVFRDGALLPCPCYPCRAAVVLRDGSYRIETDREGLLADEAAAAARHDAALVAPYRAALEVFVERADWCAKSGRPSHVSAVEVFRDRIEAARAALATHPGAPAAATEKEE